MKGLFVTAPGTLSMLELPEPEVGPYDALVEVLACGICNSTDWKILEGRFQHGSYPVLLGHESVGRVVQVGSKVKSFTRGDVVLRSYLRDDQVPMPGGRSRWGGFVERAIVTDAWAEKGVAYGDLLHRQQIVPPEIDSVAAVAAVTLKENMSCLSRTDVQAGQSLAIVGTGPVAQALVFVANLRNISPIVVFGRRPQWRDRLLELGADEYVCGDDLPPLAGKVLSDGGFDRTIEAVGAREALSTCRDITRPDGRINLYGVPPEDVPGEDGSQDPGLSDARYFSDQLEADPRIFRSKVLEAEAHEELMDLAVGGNVDLAQWISDSVPWTEYRSAFDRVRAKESNKIALVVHE